MIVIPDYREHFQGEREVVNWDRRDPTTGEVRTHFNVPVMYIRPATAADYRAQSPSVEVPPHYIHYWWVSVD